jgi:protein gp37
MSKTPIEWTQQVWNPVRGCTRISPGCQRCYAERDAARKNKNPKIPSYHGFSIFHQNHQPHWTGKVEFQPQMLDVPRKRKTPTTYFVNSMSDLFHPTIPSVDLLKVYRVMYETPRHTYQILTKHGAEDSGNMQEALDYIIGRLGPMPPHIWHGVSVESPDYYYRLDVLIECPVSVRFASLEPLLAELDIRRWVPILLEDGACSLCGFLDSQRGHAAHCEVPHLDWVIVGGESGPGATPMHPYWPRSIQAQCAMAGVPFFFKQWGGWMPVATPADWLIDKCRKAVNWHEWPDGSWSHEVGKKLAGRLLDGREWNEMPRSYRIPTVPTGFGKRGQKFGY